MNKPNEVPNIFINEHVIIKITEKNTANANIIINTTRIHVNKRV